MFRPGEILGGDFEIRGQLSQGGMGAVFLAHQLSTDTPRALKVMLPEWTQQPELRARFEQEAKISGRIPSEHVVKVVAYGIDPERQIPWLAMEYLRGSTLEERVAQLGVPPPSTRAEILRQLFHGIAAAHSLGIVHRDLKPSNVFIADSQRADTAFTLKVLDFGIAKILGREPSATQAMGTHAWKAPEQDHPGMIISPAADVWALGLLVFWLMHGRNFWRHLEEAPSRLSYEVHFEPIPAASVRSAEYGIASIGPDFDAWFAACVARDPSQRFNDARACWQALQGILPQLSGGSQATPWQAARPAAHPSASPRPFTTRAAPESVGTSKPAQVDILSPLKPKLRGLPRIAAAAGISVLLGGLAFVELRGRTGGASNAAPLLNAPGATRNSAAPTGLTAPTAQPIPPPDMVYVPPGELLLAADSATKQAAQRHTATLRGFFIDRTEVTVKEYADCVAQGKCSPSSVHGPDPVQDDPIKYGKYCNATRPGHAQHPINCIDRSQAEAVCRFMQKRLPSEAEWEYGARGTDDRAYPWGNAQPAACSMAVISGLCPATGTQPVGSRALDSASPFGALDMSGNVWEWVADHAPPDPQRNAGANPRPAAGSERGVLRGGSWDFAASYATTSRRLLLEVSEGQVGQGVRCARDP